MAASVGVESGRVFSASSASTMPAARLAVMSARRGRRHGLAGPRGGAEQLRQHRVGDRAAAPPSRAVCCMVDATGARLLGVGFGAGVGEDQRAESLRGTAIYREGDIAAHR